MRTNLPILALLIAPVACHPAQHRAETALAEARYPDALHELHNLEAKASRRNPRYQARYALERGLAHLAVDDIVAAEQWLGLAWVWHQYDPMLLSPCERSRLATAWRSIHVPPHERVDALGVAETGAPLSTVGQARHRASL